MLAAELWHARAMNLADERVRERLALNGPVGLWKTMPGSHTRLFDESIRFDADGSGEMNLRSALGGAQRLRFRWHCERYATVACQPVDDEPTPMPMPTPAGEPEPADWFRIAFCFEQSASDVGSHWVMRERDTEGFWELMTPLVPA
jgi:hypothetical protein